MRVVAAALIAMMAWFAMPALAGPMGEKDEAAIRDTITRQLEAFKRDDGTEAYSHAAPNIQAMFPTPEAFMAMVKQGYQPVYRPQEYRFLDLDMTAGRLQQKVEIVGPDGDFWTAVYSLERQGDGSWKITGCYLIKIPGGAA